MSAQIIQLPYITLFIRRIADYTTNHQSGRDNIPHLCVKARHNQGFAWFGVHITAYESRQWSTAEYEKLSERFVDSMYKICDVQELVTDLPRLMDSIQDVVTGRKRPTLFGGEGNDLLQMHMGQNVQLDVYRGKLNPDTLTYGGFEGQLYMNGQWFNCFLYHRGIILTNYIDQTIAKGLAEEALQAAFPEVFGGSVDIEIDAEVDRTRNKIARRQAA